MGVNFKAQVERDLHTVFHNTDEFATDLEFWIDGKRFKGPVILDTAQMQTRERQDDDHAPGISRVDLVMYAPLALIKTVPAEGLRVEIGDDLYEITKSAPEMGDVILHLERMTE